MDLFVQTTLSLLLLIFSGHLSPCRSLPLETTTEPLDGMSTIPSYNEPTAAQAQYKFAVVADLEEKARIQSGRKGRDKWMSQFRTGLLRPSSAASSSEDSEFQVEWDNPEPEVVTSGISSAHRGNELSTLNLFNGTLRACDEKTGIVYRLIETPDKHGKSRRRQAPWVILGDGDGTSESHGFSCSWGLVKDNLLWIGSSGDSTNNNYVKSITTSGAVTHHNWQDHYSKIEDAIKTAIPKETSVSHGAVAWSDLHRKWALMSRLTKLSDDNVAEHSNVLVIADESFSKIQVLPPIGETHPSLPVSSLKWLPDSTNPPMLAGLKSAELPNSQVTFVFAIDMRTGKVNMRETKLDDIKYEGLEFLA